MENTLFVLASASPRRRDLLAGAGVPHTVFVTDADESVSTAPDPALCYAAWFAREVSFIKGEAALEAILDKNGKKGAKNGENRENIPEISGREQVFVISADTVVSPDGVKIFGKPKSSDHAREMLRELSGKTHYVFGGITVSQISRDGVKTVSRSVETKVTFKPLSESEITAYIASGEPDGKAGAYAIQGLGSVFVTRIEGDYPNVVGISTSVLFDILSSEFSLFLSENCDRKEIKA